MKLESYSAQDLFELRLPCLPGTERSIRRLADLEEWGRICETVRGGHRYRYLANMLPEEVQAAIEQAETGNGNIMALATDSALQPSPRAKKKKVAAMALTSEQIDGAKARAALVKIFDTCMAAAPWGKKDEARAGFMQAYNGNAWPLLRQQLGDVSWQTIDRWRREMGSQQDTLQLADRRGRWKRGTSLVTDEQAKIVLTCVLHPNRHPLSEAIRMAKSIMHAKGLDNGHSEATYRRWIEQWKSKNYHIWVFNREGAKAWNDKCAYYIERDYSLINVGDIIVADGHNLNFEILSPWTGKPKRMALIMWKDMKSNYPLGWEIMPTEDTAAISSALRLAIIRLGKMPKVAYLDNGRAFRARFFEGCASFDELGLAGLYDRLGMHTIHAWPYHGQSKTVERFFGTFAELERWCPTYTGTSIEHKPPRMMRGEKLHRQVWDKAFGDYVLTMEQAHGAIAAWFDEYASRPQKGHLHGACPLELFEAGRGPGVDLAELTYLMMSQEIKTIHRNGISFLGRNYYHPALYGRRHPVIIRYDLQDKGAVYVFDQAGEFLCQATPTEQVHPAAAILGDDEHREQLQRHIEFKRQQEKEASASCRDFLRDEVIPAHQLKLAGMGIVPGQAGNGIKAKPAQPATIREIDFRQATSQAEENQARTVENKARALRHELAAMSDPDRFEKLLEMQAQGLLLCEEWQAFMRYYRASDRYRKSKDYYEELEVRLAMMYGATEKMS